MTTADIETGMGDVYQATVKSLKPSSGSDMWKIVGSIILLVLCTTGVAFFAWHFSIKEKSQQDAHTDMHSTTGTADHQRMLRRIGRNKKAAIHLHVSGQDSKGKSIQWMSDVDQSFSKGGLKLKDNTIVIPSDGVYFVYSQASFAMACRLNEEEGSQMPLSHTVLWSSPASPSAADKPKYLLDGVKSVCQASRQEQKDGELVYDVIYLGAIFQLHKGDKLSTETNHVNEIDDQGSKTFFGVFEL